LAKILVQAGTKDIKVGALVCIIVENQADVAAFKNFKETADAPAAAAAPATKAAPGPAAPPPPVPAATVLQPPQPAAPATQQLTAVEQKYGDRVFASPMAKKLAESQKLRLAGRGTGIYGSIKSGDLAGLAAGAPAGPASHVGHEAPRHGHAKSPAPIPKPAPGTPFIDIPVSNIRGVIAKRLLESKTTIPHFYLTMDCDADEMVKLRARLNKELEKKGIKLSITDFLIKALAMASTKVPETNSYWMGTHIRQFNNVDVSVAVATDRGLITPIIFSADRKGIIEISKDVKTLAAKAREGKLQPSEFQGGGISISTLGMYGTTSFSAIINPPQSCILAVGTIQNRIVPDKNSETGYRPAQIISVTLSCDHRVVDGAVGAQWLQYFQKYVQDPVQMIV
jgi:pyruvate dehydrogenase E2 component (dihydrolipoamide acetyltransferase)